MDGTRATWSTYQQEGDFNAGKTPISPRRKERRGEEGVFTKRMVVHALEKSQNVGTKKETCTTTLHAFATLLHG